MNRGLVLFGVFTIVGIVDVSYASPPVGPAKPSVGSPPPPAPAPALKPIAYYRPSQNGAAGPSYPTAGQASQYCMPSYTPVQLSTGQVTCETTTTLHEVLDITCGPNEDLVVDNQLPNLPGVAGLGKADQCIAKGASRSILANFKPATCAYEKITGMTKQVNPGLDKCVKDEPAVLVQRPGDTGSGMANPTNADRVTYSVKCPSGSTIKTSGTAVYCQSN